MNIDDTAEVISSRFQELSQKLERFLKRETQIADLEEEMKRRLGECSDAIQGQSNK